jgi:pilus assembly protein CpaE
MDALAPARAAVQIVTPLREPAPPAVAYILDADSEGVVRRCFTDLGYVDGRVVRGSIDTAIEELARRGWPRFLIIDVSGIGDPLPRINHLAEVCDLATEVIVIGDRNDIVLYRDLRAAGVAEYFFKPLFGNLISRTLAGIASGTRIQQPSRTGRLVFFLGVRGGVGVTTIATNLAWYLAEARERRVLLLDLDLQNGDAALQLDAQPSHALREALEDPARVDELFLERGVSNVTNRLCLLAGLEPLSDQVAPNEDAFVDLLQKLLPHYRYVFVDLPRHTAQVLPKLLHMPATILLVSDGGIAGARDVGRWRAKIGPNTPERTLLHVLNKHGADGDLPDQERLRMIPDPDVCIRWDRQIMSASTLGTKNVQTSRAIREGMSALSLQLSGGVAEVSPSLWKRIFSRWA